MYSRLAVTASCPASWALNVDPRNGGGDLKTPMQYLGADCMLHQLGATPNSRARGTRETPTLVKKTMESGDLHGTAHTTEQAYAHRAFERAGDPTRCGFSWEGSQRPWERTQRPLYASLASRILPHTAGSGALEPCEETLRLPSALSGQMLKYAAPQTNVAQA